MRPNLNPTEPLTQVVFIHNYLQLVFQDVGFSIYNNAKLVHNQIASLQGSPGFCDALVSLIGQRVVGVAHAKEFPLTLSFENGAQFMVLSGEFGARGPEAFQFNGQNNLIVVEQNA